MAIRPPTARGVETKDKLLAAAMELVWLNGYGSTTIDQVCARAGVLKGSFYHCFKSKPQLVAEALAAHWQARRVELDRIFSAGTPPMERLETYLVNTFLRQGDFQRRHGRVPGCPYFSLASEVSHHHGALARQVEEIIRQYCRYFESAVRDGQADGWTGVGEPLATARALFSYIEGALTQARIRNDLDLVADMAEGAMRMIGAPLVDEKVKRTSHG